MLSGRSAVVWLTMRDLVATTVVVGLTWTLFAAMLCPGLGPRAYRWGIVVLARTQVWAWPDERDAILDHAVSCLVGGGADARETMAWADRLR